MKNAFSSIIGYTDIKNELLKICDTLKNPEKYEKLGVKPTKNLLLYGQPGTGKTTIANCFIKESGLNSYICRKTKSNGDFLDEIVKTFELAEENLPSIVLLDDVDKFSDNQRYNNNSKEYVTIQSCMDKLENKNVFVLATANEKDVLPDSLLRSGRFGNKICISAPKGEDAENVVRYYLSKKNTCNDLDAKVISRILANYSCATLEEIINNAGIIAGYEGKEKIKMSDIIESILCKIYHAPKTTAERSNIIKRIANHEAGHIVVAELLNSGSVTLASVRSKKESESSGFMNVFFQDNAEHLPEYFENDIMISLAGKAAIEIIYGTTDVGSNKDVQQAYESADHLVEDLCTYGFDCFVYDGYSKEAASRRDKKTADLLIKLYADTKKMLIENRAFLDEVTKALIEKETIIATDIAKIKIDCGIK